MNYLNIILLCSFFISGYSNSMEPEKSQNHQLALKTKDIFIQEIFPKLEMTDLFAVEQTCKQWKDYIDEASNTLFHRVFPIHPIESLNDVTLKRDIQTFTDWKLCSVLLHNIPILIKKKLSEDTNTGILSSFCNWLCPPTLQLEELFPLLNKAVSGKEEGIPAEEWTTNILTNYSHKTSFIHTFASPESSYADYYYNFVHNQTYDADSKPINPPTLIDFGPIHLKLQKSTQAFQNDLLSFSRSFENPQDFGEIFKHLDGYMWSDSLEYFMEQRKIVEEKLSSLKMNHNSSLKNINYLETAYLFFGIGDLFCHKNWLEIEERIKTLCKWHHPIMPNIYSMIFLKASKIDPFHLEKNRADFVKFYQENCTHKSLLQVLDHVSDRIGIDKIEPGQTLTDALSRMAVGGSYDAQELIMNAVKKTKGSENELHTYFSILNFLRQYTGF